MRNAAVALLTVLSFHTSVRAALSEGWTQHHSERFGYTLEYPSAVFATERQSEQGDGTLFITEDGHARLLVGALFNESGFTPASYQSYITRHSYPNYTIEYQRREATWFVLSGRGGGNVFYEKVMFACDGRLLSSLALIYPEEEQPRFNPIVERIEASFRPGRKCEQPGMPPDTAYIPPRPRIRDRYDELSALADRIARERGRDVIVTLRRTRPPYDRKFVHGYAD
jgi:hypothetical protein